MVESDHSERRARRQNLLSIPANKLPRLPPLPGVVPGDNDGDMRGWLEEVLLEHSKKTEEQHAEVLAAVSSIRESLPVAVAELLRTESGGQRTGTHTRTSEDSSNAYTSTAPSVSLKTNSLSYNVVGVEHGWASSSRDSSETHKEQGGQRKDLLRRLSQEPSEDPQHQGEEPPPTASEDVAASRLSRAPSCESAGLAARLGMVKSKEVGWRRLVHHPLFEMVVSFLIIVSVVVTFVDQQLQGYEADVALGLTEAGRWKGVAGPLATLERMLCAVFVLEVSLRMAADGLRKYFGAKSNWFDLFIVLVGSIESHFLHLVAAEMGQSLTSIRLVRFARIVRSMRAVRQLKVLAPLNVLVRTIVASCVSLFWSLVVLGILHLTAALMLAQSLHSFIMDDTQDEEARKWVNRMYGSGGRSLYTFFEITYSGGWPAKVRPLVEDVGSGYAWFFAFYITGVVFAVIRIISAMFLKDTLAEAARDERWAVQQKENDKRRTADRIKELFSHADMSGDGTISIEEFRDIFKQSKMRTWCELMELKVDDVDGLFDLLDDGDGVLRYGEFVDGMLRLKGPASSRDMLTLTRESQKIGAECKLLRQMLLDLQQRPSIVFPRWSCDTPGLSTAAEELSENS